MIALNPDDETVAQAAERLYDELRDKGADVFYDDRSERPGVKFNDADLVGFPVRIVVGARSLAEGRVELSLRREPRQRIDCPLNEATARALALLEE